VFDHPLCRGQDQGTLAEGGQSNPIEFPFDLLDGRCGPMMCPSFFGRGVFGVLLAGPGGSVCEQGRPWWWRTVGIWSRMAGWCFVMIAVVGCRELRWRLACSVLASVRRGFGFGRFRVASGRQCGARRRRGLVRRLGVAGIGTLERGRRARVSRASTIAKVIGRAVLSTRSLTGT
jgi:hypothetical protein